MKLRILSAARLSFPLASAIAAMLGATSLHAITLTWDTASGDGAVITDGAGTWTDGAGNWNNAGADVNWANANPDDAIFGGGTLGAFGTVTLGSAITAGSLTFNTPNGGGAYTIDTSTFGLTLNTGITANESATIQSGIGGSIILGATNAWSVAATKTLAVSSTISGATFGITKTGSGALTLSNTNTYTGQTTVTLGTLNASAINALGTGAALLVNGGTLDISTFDNTVGSVTLTSGNINGTTGILTGTSFAVESGSASAILAGTGAALTKTTGGTVTLSGANTYDGGTNVNGGVLALGSSGALGTTGTISFGGGALQFSASNTTDYSARFSTAAGQAYNLDTNGQDVTLGTTLTSVGGTLTKSGVGTLTVTGTNALASATINGGIIAGGTLTLSSGATALTSSATSAVNSNVTITTAAGTITSSAGTLTLGGTVDAGSLALTFEGAGNTTLSSAIANGTTLIKNGAGILTLAGTNIFTSATTNGGTITGGTLELSAGATALTSSATSAINSNVTITTAAGTITSSAGTLTLGGTVDAGSLALTFDGAGNTTVSNAIANGTTLTKNGGGLLTLSGANSFTGVTINAGTVSGTTNASAFGAGTITLGDTSGSANATLSGGFNGTFINPISVAAGNTGVATITSTANTPIFSGGVTLNTHALRLLTAANNLTLSGGITGTGNLTLDANGAGVITLSGSGANNTGTITNSGTGTATNLITGGVGSNVTGITLNSTTSALTISTAALTVNSGGTTLTNTAGTKLLTVSGGVGGTGNLVLNNNSATASGITLSTTSVNNLGTITNSGSGTGTSTISAVIGTSVTGVVQNSATSALTLSGNNTFTTGVTIKAGTVSGTTSANAFGTTAGTITLGDTSGSADATLSGGFNGTFANPISVAAGNTGVATITSTANTPTFSGVVTLNSHALRLLTAANNLTLSGGITGTGNLVLNANGAGVITLSGGASGPNNTGTITNSGTGAATNVISGLIGANVTGLLQNSATSNLTLSGATSALSPTFSGNTQITAGKINLPQVALGGTWGNSAVGLFMSPYDTTGTAAAGVGIDLSSASNTLVLGGLLGNVDINLAVEGNWGTVPKLALNPQQGVSVSYSGVISNGAAGMTFDKIGRGTQTLTNTNTYSGATTVWAGTLALAGASGTAQNSAFTVRGGTLLLDNTAAWADRLNNTTALSLGSLTLTSSNGAGIQSEAVGATTFAVGGKVTINNGTTGGDQTTLALGAVTRSAGAAIDFVGTGGTLGGGVNSPNVTTTGTFPGGSNGILPWATVNGTTWAGTASTNSIVAYAGAFVDPTSAASNAADNAQLTGTGVIASAKSFNSLNVIASAAGQSLNLSANTGNLTLTSGAILKSGTDAYTISSSGSPTLGNITAGTELIAHVDGGALTISAPLNTAILGIAKGGTGNLILSGTRVANMTGATSIAGGQLEFQGAGFTLSGVVTGAGGLTVNLNPGQTLIMGNNANSYTGQTIVKGGYLSFSAFNSIGLPGGITAASWGGSSNTSLAGSNLKLDGGIIYNTYVFDRDLGDGPNQVQITSGTSGFVNTAVSGGAVAFELDNGKEIVWGSTYFSPSVFVHSTVGNLTSTLANGFDLNGSTRTILVGDQYYNANAGGGSSALSGVIRTSSGTAGLTKTGFGTLILSGANTFNGVLAVNTGVVNIQNATALGSTAAGTTVDSGAALQIQGGITVGAEALTLNGTGFNTYDGALRNISGTNTYGGLVTLGSSTRINSDAGTLTFSNAGPITGATFGLTVGGAGNTTINSGIGTTTGGLTKDGAGTLTLTGTNTYTGNTLVSTGTLQVTNQVSLYNNETAATWSKTNINVAIGATMAFNVGGAGQFTRANIDTLLGLSDSTGNGFMTGAILGLDTTAGTFLFDSVIANPNGGTNVLSLTKLGINTLALDQANTYTGGTLISAGALHIGFGSTTGSLSTSSAILNNSTLAINRSNAVAQGTDFSALPITGTGTFVQVGSGTTTLSAANTFSGTTTVSAGVLNLTNALALQNSALVTTGAGTVTVTGPTTLTLGGLSGVSGDLASVITSGYTGAVTDLTLNTVVAGPFTYGGAIANGAMTLTKTGTGTQILSGVNLYTGTTTINRGTLTIGNGTTGSLNGTTGTALTFTGTGTFNVAEAAGSTQGMGALTLSAGDATITSTGIVAQNSTLTFASLAARSVGATGNFTLATNTTAAQNKIVLTSTTNAPLNGSGSNNPGIFFGGTEYARYDTTNNRFRAVTYGTDFNASAIVATGATLGINDATKDVKVSGNITAQTTASVNTLNLVATTMTLSSTAQVLSINGILSTGATIATAGRIQPAVAGGEIVIHAASGNTSINQIIQNNTSASSLTKSGTGELRLNSLVSTYSGGTVVNAGTITNNTAGTGTATDTVYGTGPVIINPGATLALARTYLANALTLNNATVTSGNSFTSTLAPGATTTLIGTSTINVTGNLLMASNMTGSGGFIRTGSVNVPVTGNNNYTGRTTVNSGMLTFSKPAALYNATTASWTPANITVASGAFLGVNYGGGSDFSSGDVTTLLSQLTTGLAYDGLQAGSSIGFDTTNASGTYSGTITDSSGSGGGSVGLIKIGANTLTLSGNNTFSGPVSVGGLGGTRGDTLSVSSFNSVNGGSPLLASSSLGRPTTVANGTITFGNTSSNQGAGLIYTGTGETTDRVLRIALGGGTMTITQSGASGLLKFTSNTQNASSAARTLNLQGSTDGRGEIEGALVDAGGTVSTFPLSVTKSGTGTWTLSGANFYSGVTTASGGALVLANANALYGGIGVTGGRGALTFNGGVIGLGVGDFTRSLAAANTIGAATFTGAGGWAAYGADRLVNLGGASAPIIWGTASTGFNGQTLILGNTTATHMLTLQNPLDLGASVRTVQVDNGGAATDGTLSGLLSGVGGALTKTGLGTLALSGSNDYTGATNVNQGKLLINGNQSTATGLVTVASGATLGGTGTIGGATTIQSGGIYSPGASAGTLNQAGGLTIAAGGFFDWENNTINTLGSAGTNWDVANVTGTTTISSTASTGSKLRLMFTDAATSFANSFWDANQSWKFITGGVTAGNLFDTSNITVFVNALQQGASNLITGEGFFSTAVNGSDLDLTWTNANTYAYWAAAWSGPALSNQAADADPDADGLENALEYVIGTDPRTPNQGGPTGSVVGTNLVYAFSRVDSSETSDVSLVVQVSTDLIDWTTISGYTVGATTGTSSAGVSITENGAAADAITVTIPIGTDPSKFARLNVIVTP